MAVATPPPDLVSCGIDQRTMHDGGSRLLYSSSSTSSSSPGRASPIDSEFPTTLIVTPESLDSPCITEAKTEELEDENTTLERLRDVEEAKPIIAGPRKRGRPRIHPIVETKKSAHARSKTGCATCRRRKKKCDEGRPSCVNCEKNNVYCEGYDEKKTWRSGKQKAQHSQQAMRTRSIPQFWPGVEDAVDFQFFDYYVNKLGSVLCVHDGKKYNPFIDVIMPMAAESEGLMASILYLSGSSLVANGMAVDKVRLDRLAQHSGKAIASLTEEISKIQVECDDDMADAKVAKVKTVDDILIAQTLLLCLQTICAGDLQGQWACHVSAMKFMLSQEAQHHPNEQFRQFMVEFTLYHDYSSAITAIDNPLNTYTFHLVDKLTTSDLTPIDDATLLGVRDGLFGFISRIRDIRDAIIAENNNCVRGEHYVAARVLHEELQQWQSPYVQGSTRYWTSLLYQQCVGLYLRRAIMPSKPSPLFKEGVDKGLEHLHRLPQEDDEHTTQSVLLLPLFLLGCSAFEKEQRHEIARAFDRLEQWSSLGNIKHARAIVEDIWGMMDDGRADETWYWEGIIHRRGWDFLIT